MAKKKKRKDSKKGFEYTEELIGLVLIILSILKKKSLREMNIFYILMK